MTDGAQTQWRAGAVKGLVAAALGGYVLFSYFAPVDAGANPAPQGADAAKAALLTLPRLAEAPGLNAFTAVTGRPLFFAERRPRDSAATAADSKGAASSTDIRLRGLVRTQTAEKALLTREDERDGEWVSVGDEFDGWRVVAIGAARVDIERNGRRVALGEDIAPLAAQGQSQAPAAAQRAHKPAPMDAAARKKAAEVMNSYTEFGDDTQ